MRATRSSDAEYAELHHKVSLGLADLLIKYGADGENTNIVLDAMLRAVAVNTAVQFDVENPSAALINHLSFVGLTAMKEAMESVLSEQESESQP